MTSIATTFVTYNCIMLDYCIEAAIRSALEFSDEVIINDGNSTDDTFEILTSLQQEFGKGRVKLVRRAWVHDIGWQERERNFAAQQTNCDWLMLQDADECFHEKDADILKIVSQDKRYNLVNFEVLHFYGLPCFTNPNPQWYHRHTRMGRRSVDFGVKQHPGGCVSDVYAFGRPCHTYRGSDIAILKSDHAIYHYGWVRDARVAGVKLNKFNGWYANDSKYFDGYLDSDVPFDYKLEEYVKDLTKFRGTHPDPVYKWFAERNRLIKYDPETNKTFKYEASPFKEGKDFVVTKEE